MARLEVFMEMQGLEMQDAKMADRMTGLENVWPADYSPNCNETTRHEFARQGIVGSPCTICPPIAMLNFVWSNLRRNASQLSKIKPV